MITLEYSVEEEFETIPYPVILKKTFNDGVLISTEPVSYIEAQLAGVNLETFFNMYKAYIQTYLDSMTTMSDESSASQRSKHEDLSAATVNFFYFMVEAWALDSEEDLT